MTDYADWTESAELLGTEIQVPIDIQGAFIQVPIDIQGQYVDLRVDIVAQTIGNIGIDIKAQTIGNIAVNIAASAVTLNVNISSQSANIAVNIAASAVTLNVNISSQTGNVSVNIAAQSGNVTISVAAQTVGVYLQPEWAANQGVDKNISGYASGTAPYGYYVITYTVTAGKVFYVNQFSGIAYGSTTGSRLRGTLEVPGATTVASSGGDCGFAVTLAKPMKATAGQTVRLYLYTYGAGTADTVYGTINGYEI